MLHERPPKENFVVSTKGHGTLPGIGKRMERNTRGASRGRADDPRISRFRDRTKILCRTGMYLSSAEGRHTNISDGGGGTEP